MPNPEASETVPVRQEDKPMTANPNASPLLELADRSGRAEVRNPILAIPAFKRISELPIDAQRAVREICLDLSSDARGRADKCWRTHKAPMALYWKCVAVYSGHLARAIGRDLSAALRAQASETGRG